jgi:hypothetical protein
MDNIKQQVPKEAKHKSRALNLIVKYYLCIDKVIRVISIGNRFTRLYDIKNNKNSAYHKTSKPLLAATLSGMKRVCSGSTIPIVGRMARFAIPEEQKEKHFIETINVNTSSVY